MQTNKFNAIMELVQSVTTDANLRVTMTQALRGAGIAGGGAAVGALLGGPVGMAVGGCVGAVVAAATSEEFMSLWQVINNWPHHHRQELAQRVENIMQNVNATDVAALTALVAGSAAVRQQVLDTIVNYATGPRGLRIA